MFHFFRRSLPALILFVIAAGGFVFAETEKIPGAPVILRNGNPGHVTVQDLSGLSARPFRLLVNRNNEARGEGFGQVWALGVREGDELEVPLETVLPGMRVTLYKISHEKDDRLHVSMPYTEYFAEPATGRYRERFGPVEEEFWVVVFEKTDSPDEKNIQVRYFEERVRQLVITSFKTNFTLSSLKLKMKDDADRESGKFVRDTQLLVDRLKAPQKILVIRLWIES